MTGTQAAPTEKQLAFRRSLIDRALAERLNATGHGVIAEDIVSRAYVLAMRTPTSKDSASKQIDVLVKLAGDGGLYHGPRSSQPLRLCNEYAATRRDWALAVAERIAARYGRDLAGFPGGHADWTPAAFVAELRDALGDLAVN